MLTDIKADSDEKFESPEYVRTSLAAAMTLKFVPGKFYRDAKLYCINLLMLYKDGCKANCAYCGLSKSRPGVWESKSFIRVDWPVYPLKDVIQRMKKYESEIRRVCVSMITHKRAAKDVETIVSDIHAETDIPISVLISPTVMNKEVLIRLKQAGADRIGVAIDAATPELFEKYRGRGVNGPHRWEKYWKILEESLEVFGRGYAGVHLIVGLGETEREMIEAIQKAQDLGAETHLFSFYPEPRSLLANHSPPPVDQYRRIQIARYLINNNISRYDLMKFDAEERVIDFGISPDKLREIIEDGEAFMTSGCPDRDGCVACNRPYANERPGDIIRNYPFKPEKQDIEEVKKQLGFNL
ncbi:MAG: radical SAM protein [Candidatus Odinarchaeia archaeon]